MLHLFCNQNFCTIVFPRFPSCLFLSYCAALPFSLLLSLIPIFLFLSISTTHHKQSLYLSLCHSTRDPLFVTQMFTLSIIISTISFFCLTCTPTYVPFLFSCLLLSSTFRRLISFLLCIFSLSTSYSFSFSFRSLSSFCLPLLSLFSHLCALLTHSVTASTVLYFNTFLIPYVAILLNS